ncbi:MAG: ABC transporter ATP-binding protein [Actinobacteria bacterium]|nr:ABC transporter ATP-binding protein [Actinomycetota bacterium]
MNQLEVYEELAVEGVNSDSQSEASPAVVFEKVSKTFLGSSTQSVVLEEISFTVAVGEFICLVGASGCGKSTLLNLVAGLEEPTTGTVSRPGGKVALLFQDAALLPWLTAGENVELALRLRGVKRVRRRSEAERLLTLVHLEGLHSSPIHELSGGMRQRVALARALAQEPRILLMDEPFGALDAITRDVLHEELIRIWRATGLTIIFVTHNVREAVRLGQRVKLMASRPGRVIGDWTVDIRGERRIESPAVAELAIEITDELRREIRSHASGRE